METLEPASLRQALRIRLAATLCWTHLLGLFICSVIPSRADSYSITLQPGYNLIANQLDNGGNTLAEVLPTVPDGTALYLYPCGSLYAATYSLDFGGWDNPSLIFAPGQGALLFNPEAAFSLTFSGTPHVPVLPITLCSPADLVSRQTNDIGTYENIAGLPPSMCTTTRVYRFNPGPGRDPSSYVPPNYTVYTFLNGAWDPQAPLVNVGEAVWIETETATPTVAISSQPTSATVAACSAVTFTVTATGNGPLSYQWYFNDQSVAGATTASYEISSVNSTNAGAYTVAVGDSCFTMPSAHAFLTVNPTLVITSATVAACSNTNFTFSVTATGNGPLTYQWLFNGEPIPDATNGLYGAVLTGVTNTGAYTVRIRDSCSIVTVRPVFQGAIYGNIVRTGPDDLVEQFDRNTGALLQIYDVSVNRGGRGVAVVGNILYTTTVLDPHIYKTDLTTGVRLESILTPIESMATLAWDGSHFWTTDYSDQNKAYELDAAGNLIKTITLSLSEGDSDGLEYFNGKLIANRGDAVGVYDIYDLDGNVLVANFIDTGTASTGIAFDGQNFIISDIVDDRLSVWDGATGAFIKYIELTGRPAGQNSIEDLSVDYNTLLGTCTGDVTVGNDPGACGAVVNFTVPDLSSGCPDVTTTCSPPANSLFPVGTTTVSCTSTNAGGAVVAQCSFKVTVTDNERPIVRCPANLVVCADPGQSSKSNVTFSATATDNCPGVNVSCDPPSGATFPVGPTTVHCLATNAVGASNSCSFILVVNARTTGAPLPNLTHCRGDSATFTAVTAGGGALTYAWSLDGTPIGTDSPLLIVSTGGLTEGSHTVQYIVSGECGSVTNRATLIIQSCASGGPCSFTQGFYGNAKGKFNGTPSLTLISNLLASGPLVVGKPGTRSLIIPQSAVPLLQQEMPSSSSPATLPANGDQNLLTAVLPLNKGKFANILLGQTITLSLNVRLDPTLSGVQLRTNFCTQGVSAGPDGSTGTADDLPVSGDVQMFTIPNSVLAALTNPGLGINDLTVHGLLELANRALAGLPTGGASLSDINSAVDNINRGFDGCRILVDCATHAPLPPSPNDSFGHPTVLTNGGPASLAAALANSAAVAAPGKPGAALILHAEGFNCDATKEPGEPPIAGNAGGKSVWWQWQSTISGWVTIQTGGSTFDTLLAVYTGGNFSTLKLVASSDDTQGSITAQLTFQALLGETYLIGVDGFDGACGKIDLNVVAGAPHLTSVTLLPGAGLAIAIEGELGRSYVIEGSSDFVNWEPIAIVDNNNGLLQFVDPQTETSDQRFYRVSIEN